MLKFTPHAWAKLVLLRDLGGTEIGGFGITSPDDLLLVQEVVLVPQECTAVEVRFDDDAIADFFDQQVGLGRWPEQFGRIWIHTHPGNSAQPSGTDEETFERVFGKTDWAVMFILARGGQSYARLRYNTGPGCEMQLPVEVDYSQEFDGSDQGAWEAEYDRCVEEIIPVVSRRSLVAGRGTDRRMVDPWPGEDEPTSAWATDDWSADEFVDQYYDAWLDYADPEDFPVEVAHDCHS